MLPHLTFYEGTYTRQKKRYIYQMLPHLTFYEGTYTRQKKRNAPRRAVQLSERSQVIGQFSLSQCKGM